MHKANLFGGFNPIEKYYIVNWIISPNRGEHQKYLSCHHLETHKSSNNILQRKINQIQLQGQTWIIQIFFAQDIRVSQGLFVKHHIPKRWEDNPPTHYQVNFFSHFKVKPPNHLHMRVWTTAPREKKDTQNDRKFMGFTGEFSPFHCHLLTRFFFLRSTLGGFASRSGNFWRQNFLPIATLIKCKSLMFFPYESQMERPLLRLQNDKPQISCSELLCEGKPF